MSLRFHEIAESDHDILNPISLDRLEALEQVCRLERGTDHLDIASGKGTMLCHWAKRHPIRGIGVDLSTSFCADARERSAREGVDDRLTFVQAEGAQYLRECNDHFDIVSCLGATWIGGGLSKTLDLLTPRLRDDKSFLLIGEVFWTETPPEEAVVPLSGSPDTFVHLEGTLDRFEAKGLELVEMFCASESEWDRYYASQWLTVSDWLRQNPKDPEGPTLQKWVDDMRRQYLRWERRYLGWGIFVLRRARPIGEEESAGSSR
jgi:hypothetical protein